MGDVITMPPFHTSLGGDPGTTGDGPRKVAGWPLLPLRVTIKGGGRGPAPSTNQEDVVDQSLDLFKANILFKNFEIETDVDRVQVYITLYIIECLKKLQKSPNKERGGQDMYSLALENFALPGEAGFPLNAFYPRPSKQETDELKQFMTQLRQETGARLVERVFAPELSQDGKPSKWWVCFAKRKFLNVSLSAAF